MIHHIRNYVLPKSFKVSYIQGSFGRGSWCPTSHLQVSYKYFTGLSQGSYKGPWALCTGFEKEIEKGYKRTYVN